MLSFFSNYSKFSEALITKESKAMSNKVFKTPEQLKTLEKYYLNGMTSYGKDNKHGLELLAQAVEETNLSEQIVKDWIRNRKKGPRVTEKVNIRKPRGYDFFKSEWLKVNDATFSEANSAWKELPDEEKNFYNEKATDAEEPEFSAMPLEWQRKKIRMTRKKISNLVCLLKIGLQNQSETKLQSF
eukprot:TCONS_00025675-protein